MRLTSLSLYAAIWLASTAFGLVARPSNLLHPRADTTPKFPKGFNARTCPSDGSNVILKTEPPESEALRLPASAPHSALTRRVPPQPDPTVVCRLISVYPFMWNEHQYWQHQQTMTVKTELLQTGVYAVTVSGNKNIRGLSITREFPYRRFPHPLLDHTVRDNPTDSVGIEFTLESPALVQFHIVFWDPNTAGEVCLFRLQSGVSRAAFPRVGTRRS